MRTFHIVLVDHCITERCVYLAVTQQHLHLLDGHALINGFCCQSSPELVRVNILHPCILPELAKPSLYPTNLQALEGLCRETSSAGASSQREFKYASK